MVGYREGGIPELLGECGRLVPTGDRESLAAALVEVLTEPAVHGAMARCGLGRVRESFAPERALEETKEVYRQAARIAHRHGRAGPSNRWCRAESQRTP